MMKISPAKDNLAIPWKSLYVGYIFGVPLQLLFLKPLPKPGQQ